jgi:multidrug efflux pump subunit AcrB
MARDQASLANAKVDLERYRTLMVEDAIPEQQLATQEATVRQFGRIAGISEMTSTSYLGATSIVLQFDLSRDIDAAARDVQAAINAARSNLPSNLPANPNYRKVNPAEAPILILSLSSETTEIAQIYDIAASILQQKLAQTSGIGQVFVGGSSLPAVRVELNPAVVNKYGIDNLSMMALTISAGFVVDDAIVVIENITRHVEHGVRPFEAALQGAQGIGFTVISISTSLIAVFIPILLMQGIVGRLFREFAVTLSIAIMVSMLVSLTTTPMMCARFLKRESARAHGWFYRTGGRALDRIVERYGAALRVVLRHPAVTLSARTRRSQ